MRILFYFLDAHRNLDYEECNPYYHFLVNNLNPSYKYYSEFPSTYRWLWSTFNSTNVLESVGYDMNKNGGTEQLSKLPNRYKFLAKYNKLTSRYSVITKSANYDYFLEGLFDEKIECEDLVVNTKDNVIDFVYDAVLHDLVFYTKNYNKYNILSAYSDAFEYSKILLNEDFINKYDKVIVVSDHGFRDYNKDHNLIKESSGNPWCHSNGILFNKGLHIPQFDLVSNIDLLDYLYNDLTIRRETIVINSYETTDVGLPKYFWYFYKNSWYYCDAAKMFLTSDSGQDIMVLKYRDREISSLVSVDHDFLDSLYAESNYFRKLFDYLYYIS